VIHARKAVGAVALALIGVGTGWLLSVQGFLETADVRSQQVPASATEPAIPPPITSASVASSSPGDGDVAGVSGNQTSQDSSGFTLAAMEKERGDPTIARAAKLAIQGVLDSRLDQGRYQVHAVICHELSCQMLSNPQVPGAERDWPPIVEAAMQELARLPFRHPETGAELKPSLKAISRGSRKDAVTVTIIQLE
jgi:hypothetical protein